MGCDKSIFDILMKLLDYHNQVYQSSQDVLKMLVTNPPLYWGVLWLENKPATYGAFNWDDIFDFSNVNKLMYSIEIIDSFLVNDNSMMDPKVDEAKLKNDWAVRFMDQGGFEQLLKLFGEAIKMTQDLAEEDHTEVANTRKRFLDYMLRIIKVFIMAALQSEES